MSDQTGQPGPERPAKAEQPTVQQPVAPEPSAQQPVAPVAQPEPGTWGAPAQERTSPRWSWKKTAAATAVAVGVAVGGGFAVYAAGSATADGNQRGGPGMIGMGGPGTGGRGGVRDGAAAGLLGALHGEFVTADGNGGYTTKVVQSGEVTAVNDTSITVKSVDGYTKAYTIDAATVKTAVQTGTQVTVLGTPTGDTAKADSISERGLMNGPGGAQGGMPGGQQPGGVAPRRDGNGGAPDPNGGGTPPAPPGN